MKDSTVSRPARGPRNPAGEAAAATAHTDIGDVLEMLPPRSVCLLHLILSDGAGQGECLLSRAAGR